MTVTTTAPVASSLSDEAIQGLIASVRGRVIQPDDPDYDEARALYNGMIDKRPRLIARCVDVGRRDRRGQLRARPGPAHRDSRRRPQRPGPRQLRRRAGRSTCRR